MNFKTPVLDTPEKVRKHLLSVLFFQRLTSIVNGCMFLYNAVDLWYLYQPSNTEISMAILLKHLSNEGVINDKLFGIMKKLVETRYKLFETRIVSSVLIFFTMVCHETTRSILSWSLPRTKLFRLRAKNSSLHLLY
jgi:hypothetical protein